MTYRKADTKDASQLSFLRKKQLIDEGSLATNDISSELETYFKTTLDNGTLVCWVAEENSELVATGGVCFYTLPPTFHNPSGKIAYITNMYTKPGYRRRGIGSKLLNLVVDEALKKKCRVLQLHASDMGKALYINAGFTDAEGSMVLRL